MSFLGRSVNYLYGRFFVDGGDVLAKTKRVRTCIARSELLASEAVFLITPGRSGTKSLVDFCKKSSTMYSVHAPLPWLASTGYAYHQGSLSAEAAFSAFYAARESYLKSAFERNIIFFDGDCKNLPLSPVIAEMMPNSKFLHVVRNPTAFIKSGLARGYYLKKSPEMWGHLSAPIELDSQIEKVAFFWNEANVIAESMKASFGRERVQTIIADEMFASQELIVSGFDAIGLSHVFHERPVGPLNKLNSQSGVNAIDEEVMAKINSAVSKVCTTSSLYFR